MRMKPVVVATAAVLIIAVGFGMYWFAPWKLFTSHEVHDTVPVIASATPTAGAAPVAVRVAAGEFVTQEHETRGSAQLIQLPDGRRQLVLSDLATSDGPDLRVWLTDQRVIPGRAGWRVFADGRHVELGKLRGTHGTQVYEVPATPGLASPVSVTIWCVRFAVSFGAAPLR